ncbi:hypothetical protein ONZ45_g13199 [Pleurotus djamor]|nr:hypothetical protein ONZ45_g13199 [Pleurotus djamor]
MNFIASALEPIPAVLWGDHAIAALGAPVVCGHYMLVVDDVDYDDAVGRLRLAGFQDCDWSFASFAPDFYQGHIKQRVYRTIVRDFGHLDQNLTRFFFPRELPQSMHFDKGTKIALLRSSYAHIRPSDKNTYRDNIQYPDASQLLLSFIQTYLREPRNGMWTNTLHSWAISYVYGELGESMVRDDVLDGCDDAEAKAWFNASIQRFEGGMDRATCTKRLGRVNRTVA